MPAVSSGLHGIARGLRLQPAKERAGAINGRGADGGLLRPRYASFHNSETSSVSIYAVPFLTLPFSSRITQQ